VTEPADDVDQIMRVISVAFDPAFGEAWNRRQLEDSLLMGNCHYILIDCKGDTGVSGSSVAGFCLYRTGFEEIELLLLAVVPANRRKGLGRHLLEAFEDAGRRFGATQLLLEMRKGNPAETLYCSLGFAPIGHRPNYYRTKVGDRLDAITLAKVLSRPS
jgi:[ribosomal protein S18]-alanine N-acetyltransferase